MNKTDNTDKYLTKTSIDAGANDSSRKDSIDAIGPSNITPISRHLRHPSHEDKKLVEAVLRGDLEAIRKFDRRIKPFLEIHASDESWESYDIGYADGLTVLRRNGFEFLRRWNPEKRTLVHLIHSTLTKSLTTLRLSRRHAVADHPHLKKAIKACQSDLSDTHYFVLYKRLINGIPLKQLPKYFHECPELRLASVSSLGTTYSRALKRLEKVCPEEYKEVVLEFCRTRKKSGRR